MSKSIYEEALKELTWLVHDEFNDTPNRPEPNVSQRLDMFKKVKGTLEKAQKQEKLLELYRKYFNVTEHWYETNNSGNIRKETAIEIEKLESELENDNT